MEVINDRACGRPSYVRRGRNQGTQNPARGYGAMSSREEDRGETIPAKRTVQMHKI